MEEMDDSHGRFRVRRGELEIEFEGPNFIQEYKAALEHLHIVDGAQTTLGDTDFEVSPRREAKQPKSSASPPEPSGALSYVEMAKEESAKANQEYDLENPGPSPPQSHIDQSEDLLFRALARATHRPEQETPAPSAEQGSEHKHETPAPSAERGSEHKEGSKPLFDDKKPESEGAVPSDKYPDERFKEILKRMGLST